MTRNYLSSGVIANWIIAITAGCLVHYGYPAPATVLVVVAVLNSR